MKRFIKPNFKNNIINISATLAEFLGAKNNNAILPILKEELKKDYKNIVFICFDGLGIYPLYKNLDKDNILVKNIKQILTSTFPSTTTNATTSLLLNKLPLEHGWFGWSVYFKNLNRNIDIFKNVDSWTEEKIDIISSPLADLDYYFYNAKSEYKINTVFPSFVKVKDNNTNNIYTTDEEFFDIISKICNKKDKQFIYAYFSEPDHSMHINGVDSNETKKIITSISNNIEKLQTLTNNTLFIITADHGQIDTKGYVELYKDKKLYDMLEIYPYLEPRAIAFKLKEGKQKEFKKYFTKNYGKDFKLYKTKTLIKKGYFGKNGDKQELLGDFIAIGTYTYKQALLTPNIPAHKGQHTSLTEEMHVPLIMINN